MRQNVTEAGAIFIRLLIYFFMLNACVSLTAPAKTRICKTHHGATQGTEELQRWRDKI